MISDDIKDFRIILASGSSRREELLKKLGIRFEINVRDYDESYPEELMGGEIAEYVARKKAYCFKNEISDNDIIITADTIVWCNNMILGKPEDYDTAVSYLKKISGNTHEVITGVCLYSTFKERVFSVSTRVTFDILSEEEIDYYIAQCKPYDKAGAYGIQEWIGIAACSKIEGSYFNVVGLPVQRLYGELKMFVA